MFLLTYVLFYEHHHLLQDDKHRTVHCLVETNDLLLDVLNGDPTESLLAKDIAKEAIDGLEIGLLASEPDIACDSSKGPFHATHVAGNALSEEIHDFRLERNAHGLGLT